MARGHVLVPVELLHWRHQQSSAVYGLRAIVSFLVSCFAACPAVLQGAVCLMLALAVPVSGMAMHDGPCAVWLFSAFYTSNVSFDLDL